MLKATRAKPPQQLSLGQRLLRDRVLLLFALPGTALIVAFHYVPLLGNVIAFKDYQPFLGIVAATGPAGQLLGDLHRRHRRSCRR